MVVMANAGNQPECMAAIPTSIIATVDEKAAQRTQTTILAGSIPLMIPVTVAVSTAPSAYAPKLVKIVFLADPAETVIPASAFSSSAVFFLSLNIMKRDWIRATPPAPIMIP